MRYRLCTLMALLGVVPVATGSCVWTMRASMDSEREFAVMVAVGNLAVLLAVIATAFDVNQASIENRP
jgi:hypothetical protein